MAARGGLDITGQCRVCSDMAWHRPGHDGRAGTGEAGGWSTSGNTFCIPLLKLHGDIPAYLLQPSWQRSVNRGQFCITPRNSRIFDGDWMPEVRTLT